MIKKLIKQLLPYIKPYKNTAIAAFLLSFVLAGIAGGQVQLIKPLFDNGFSPTATKREIWSLAFILMGLGILNFPARFYHFSLMRRVVERMTMDMRKDVFAKLLTLPTSYYNQNKQGRLISAIVNDIEMFASSFRATIDVFREPAKAIVYLGMAIYADWQLTLVILIVGPLFVLIFQVSEKKVRLNQGLVQESKADLTHVIMEGLAGHKVTKAFNLQKFVMSRFQNAQDYFLKFQLKTIKVEELSHPFVELIGSLAFSLVIVFAYYRIQSGELTVGAFIQFIAALALLMDPIRRYSQANVKLGQGIAAALRLKDIFELDSEIDQGTKELKSFEKSIEVSNVSFAYEDHTVLKNFNISIKKGQKVALVGLSGSGKSTLINLLLRLYNAQEGQIKIDGVDIKDYRLGDLRSIFGLVSQDIFLFHDTIRANLTVGGSYSDTEISNALEVAYASEFVAKLPDGLDTIIGDRGAKLSGGQQQRLTIARAFLQNPDILLFDEATSALDNESEQIVQKALESIGGDRTVIAVAHRLSTIQHYDRIFVLKEGALIEEGDHPTLMAKDGEYKKLFELSQKN